MHLPVTESFSGTNVAPFLAFAGGGALTGLLAVPVFVRGFCRGVQLLESFLRRTPTQDIVVGAFGAIVGLLIAVLLSLPFTQLPFVGRYLPVLVTLVLGYVGTVVAVRKKEELMGLFVAVPKTAERSGLPAAERANPQPRDRTMKQSPKIPFKILDTSVIIDGRIADICKSGFLEGTLLVPGFVLEELQKIADSSDVLKRNRGRRGLDILNKMQKDPAISIQIYETNLDGSQDDVDSRLVKLARSLGAKVVTNDYNLNKVAELRGVHVLNINELANALKPVVLPGEELVVHVIKDGKESGQGVGYLDDGTMIVVDGGKRYIGEDVDVLVTSVLQTAAGRMIFARPRPLAERGS
ncbi:MAG TPA: PIN/TRAM domain-containing protein [Firmicutes bacterium]|nr:PIN/TRAM domain-containing protein [Bacillota bacterium]